MGTVAKTRSEKSTEAKANPNRARLEDHFETLPSKHVRGPFSLVCFYTLLFAPQAASVYGRD